MWHHIGGGSFRAGTRPVSDRSLESCHRLLLISTPSEVSSQTQAGLSPDRDPRDAWDTLRRGSLSFLHDWLYLLQSFMYWARPSGSGSTIKTRSWFSDLCSAKINGERVNREVLKCPGVPRRKSSQRPLCPGTRMCTAVISCLRERGYRGHSCRLPQSGPLDRRVPRWVPHGDSPASRGLPRFIAGSGGALKVDGCECCLMRTWMSACAITLL